MLSFTGTSIIVNKFSFFSLNLIKNVFELEKIPLQRLYEGF
jgi:hypothetical protein